MTKQATKHSGFLRGLIVGLAIGVICTAAAGSWAAMTKEHWEKRNWHFQAGYLAGFLDVVRILQARHPETTMAKDFRVPPKVPLRTWLDRVNSLYENEEHHDRPLTQIITIAGDEIAAEVGYIGPSGGGGLDRYQAYMERRRERQAEERRGAATEQAPSEDAADTDESDNAPGAAGDAASE